MISPKPIKITMTGGWHEDRSIHLTINANASIDDWVRTFKTILSYQTFDEDIVKELFCRRENRNLGDNNTPQFLQENCVHNANTML